MILWSQTGEKHQLPYRFLKTIIMTNVSHTTLFFFFYLRSILCAVAISELPALLNFSPWTNTDKTSLLGPWMISLASNTGVLWKINKQINKYCFNSITNIKSLMILNVLTVSFHSSKTCRFNFYLFCLN